MEKFKKAVILLSRQNLRPSLSNAWVQALLKAIQYIADKNLTLLTSIGTPNWEIITAAAVLKGLEINLIVPTDPETPRSHLQKTFKTDYGYSLSDSQLILISAGSAGKIGETEFKLRDKYIIEQADIVIPVSIRPKGHLERLIEIAKDNGREIVDTFRVEYKSKSNRLAYTINRNLFSNCIREIEDRFLIHWTRTSNSNWPTENKLAFYNSIFNSNEYPRSSFNTLLNIIESKVIKASSRNMPGRIETVSFSGLTPTDAIKLMKWRARFRQMSFEPYGIGIERQFAEKFGILPVNYIAPDEAKSKSYKDKWLTQSIGKVTDWRNEKEFRFKDDLDLRAVPNNKMIAITQRKDEAEYIKDELKLESVWFID